MNKVLQIIAGVLVVFVVLTILVVACARTNFGGGQTDPTPVDSSWSVEQSPTP